MRILITLFLAAACVQVQAQIYPYLQKLEYEPGYSSASVVIRWERLPDASTPYVGKVHCSYLENGPWFPDVLEGSPSTQHELSVTGLNLDMDVYYEWYDGTSWQYGGKFHTPVNVEVPLPVPFRFIVYGDDRTDPNTDPPYNATNHQNVVNGMVDMLPASQFAARLAFVLNVGDLTIDGSGANYYENTGFFHVEKELLRNVVIWPTVGNHDDDAGDPSLTRWQRLFVLPDAATCNDVMYSFRYGNSAFICLNVPESGSIPGTFQTGWLEDRLKSLRANPSVRHIFVFFHAPPYSSYSGHQGNSNVRLQICPLLEKYGVQLVFCGHVHAYERSWANLPGPGGGIEYITTGAGGAPRITSWGIYSPASEFKSYEHDEFVVVDVNGDAARAVAVKVDDGEMLDHTTVHFDLPDVAATAIAAVSSISRPPYKTHLTARVKNPGDIDAVCDVKLKVLGTTFDVTKTNVSVAKQGEVNLDFGWWTTSKAGIYKAELTTTWSDDANPSNDRLTSKLWVGVWRGIRTITRFGLVNP